MATAEALTQEEILDLDTSCDDMFLIVDTAKHGDWPVTITDTEEHVRECDWCSVSNHFVLEIRD